MERRRTNRRAAAMRNGTVADVLHLGGYRQSGAGLQAVDLSRHSRGHRCILKLFSTQETVDDGFGCLDVNPRLLVLRRIRQRMILAAKRRGVVGGSHDQGASLALAAGPTDPLGRGWNRPGSHERANAQSSPAK